MEKRSALDGAGRVIRFKSMRLAFGQEIGDEACPHMRRWVFIHDSGWGVRLHHFYPNHEDLVPHDHPFWFITMVVLGGYADLSYERQGVEREGEPKKIDILKMGSIRFRSAHHAHRTITDHRGAWTIVINGAKSRSWGFFPRDKSLPRWMLWTKFADGGHQRAACEPIDINDK